MDEKKRIPVYVRYEEIEERHKEKNLINFYKDLIEFLFSLIFPKKLEKLIDLPKFHFI